MRRQLASLLIVSTLLTAGFASAEEAAATPATTDNAATAASDSAASASNWFGSGLNDTSSHMRPNQFSVMANIGFGYGFGIGAGARYAISIMDDGFIPSLNDQFLIEFGADFNAYFGFFGGGIWLQIPIAGGVRYQFFFTDSLAAFVHIEAGLSIFPQGFGAPTTGLFNLFAPFGFYYSFTVGGMLNLGSVVLRAEVGWPFVKVGVAF